MTDYASFTSVDLSRLPAPAIVEQLDYETIRAAMIASYQVAFPAFDALVESDPVIKAIEVFAYRELLIRQQFNDRAQGVMIAFANGADLDHLGALFGVTRLIITPADPPNQIAEVLEDDDDFRQRIVLAPEGYSVAGPSGAYIFHALSADPRVLDASVTSPTPGAVVVTILSRIGNGHPTDDLNAAVLAYLSADSRRPLTDLVTVQGATIVDYAITAALTCFSGPDSAIVLASARARLADYVARTNRLGRHPTRAGIVAALFVEGVQNVALTSPAVDPVVDRQSAARCTAQTVTFAGIAE